MNDREKRGYFDDRTKVRTSLSTNNVRFGWGGQSGYCYDWEIDLYMLGMGGGGGTGVGGRGNFYNPLTGRMQGPDPLRAEGGNINIFILTGNNPITNKDPSGRDWWSGLFGGVTAGAGQLSSGAAPSTRPATQPASQNPWSSLLVGPGLGLKSDIRILDPVQSRVMQFDRLIQNFTTEGYRNAIRQGATVQGDIGNIIDRDTREQFRLWLQKQGLPEGPGELMRVNRRLYDQYNAYTRPDFYDFLSNQIWDPSVTEKMLSTQQIRGFRSGAPDVNIRIVNPFSSYDLDPSLWRRSVSLANKLEAASPYLKWGGRGLMVAGAAQDAWTIYHSPTPLDTGAEKASAWTMAAVGSETLGAGGAELGLLTGPAAPIVSPVLGIIGGIGGGIGGYLFGEQEAKALLHPPSAPIRTPSIASQVPQVARDLNTKYGTYNDRGALVAFFGEGSKEVNSYDSWVIRNTVYGIPPSDQLQTAIWAARQNFPRR